MIKISTQEKPNDFIDVDSVRCTEGYNYKRNFSMFKITLMGNHFIEKESIKLGYPSHITLRKKGDVARRYCSKNVLDAFLEWNISGINPNKSTYLIREESKFCKLIEDSFNGILSFTRQYKVLEYTVDLYCHELNLFIEFDEKHHLYNLEKDSIRENEIIKYSNGTFIRHDERVDFTYTINKIIKIIQNKNPVGQRLGFYSNF